MFTWKNLQAFWWNLHGYFREKVWKKTAPFFPLYYSQLLGIGQWSDLWFAPPNEHVMLCSCTMTLFSCPQSCPQDKNLVSGGRCVALLQEWFCWPLKAYLCVKESATATCHLF